MVAHACCSGTPGTGRVLHRYTAQLLQWHLQVEVHTNVLLMQHRSNVNAVHHFAQQVFFRLPEWPNFGEHRARLDRNLANVVGLCLAEFRRVWPTSGHTLSKSGHVSPKLGQSLSIPEQFWSKCAGVGPNSIYPGSSLAKFGRRRAKISRCRPKVGRSRAKNGRFWAHVGRN